LFSLALRRRFDDREALLVLFEGNVGDVEHFAPLVVRHFPRVTYLLRLFAAGAATAYPI
jgi:hypothetical protein